MPIFLGTTLTSAALAVIALFSCGEPGAAAMLAGGVPYVLGMFVVTIIFNVSLNDALAADGHLDRGLRAVHRCDRGGADDERGAATSSGLI